LTQPLITAAELRAMYAKRILEVLMYKRQQVKVWATSHVWPIIFCLAIIAGVVVLFVVLT
jgi:CHASE2 domain-containing sensor protein